MTIKSIRDVFNEAGLRLPTLSALSADAHSYTILAVQPTGEVAARNDSVGHANHDLARAKFLEFLDLAKRTDAELVLAPEYSCPWSVLASAIRANQLPADGKLWALGCEAIAKEALTHIIADNPTVDWIHEPLPTKAGQFLSVLCYLFKTRSMDGQSKTVALLQFKSQAMADIGAFERDHMIEGDLVYLLHNEDDVIRFVSLICSEALVFQPNAHPECGFAAHPFIVFHPQLNYEPFNFNMKAYRQDLFAEAVDTIEVLALNWARGFRIPPNGPSIYGGSAIYLKTNRFLRSDARLEANHSKGLYYTNWHPVRSHLSYFNYNEHVFHFRMQKARATGPGAGVLQNRTGPEMIELWKWDTLANRWDSSARADDDFQSFCDGYQEGSFACCLGEPIPAPSRERLLALSAGKLEPTVDWHDVGKLSSFLVNDDEVPRRLVFAQEQAIHSVEFRRSHFDRYIKLHKEILPDPTKFPDTIQDLKNNARLAAPEENGRFRFNILSQDGIAPEATGVFLGRASPDFAKQLLDKFVDNWKIDSTRRLVIWHEHDGQIKYQHPPLPTVTDDSEGATSIARTDAA